MAFWQDQSGARSWFTIFWGQGGWIPILLTCMTLGLTCLAVPPLLAAKTVAQDGVPVWAMVANRRIEESQTGPRHVLTYHYAFRDQDFRKDIEVSEKAFRDRSNFMGRIYHKTDDAALIAARSERLRAQARKWQNVALAAGLAALFMGWRVGRDATRAVLARRLGQEENAYVFEKKRELFVEIATIGSYKVPQPQWGRGPFANAVHMAFSECRSWRCDQGVCTQRHGMVGL